MKETKEKGKTGIGLLKFTLSIILIIAIILGMTIYIYFKAYINNNDNSNKNIDSETSTSTNTNNNNKEIKIEDKNISHDTKYGGVYVNISIEEFNNLGFEFGDSVDVMFSNGFEMTDIPYFDGYYVDEGEPLLVGYPGYEYIKLGYNYGDDLWEIANVNEETTCSISLREAKEYLKIQTVRDIHYTDDQGNMSDEVFANFRPMNIGKLKKDFVYRGASPIDNTHKRAPVVDRLIKNKNIEYVIDLADNDEEIIEFSNKEDFNSPYFMELYNNNKVSRLSMNIQYKSEIFTNKVIQALTDISNNDGPYYIQCQEGKDRTGFFAMVVGAIGGASYDELISDYMKTYENYYSITIYTSNEKYDLIEKANIDAMIQYIAEETDTSKLKDADMSEIATKYLIKNGMSEEQIKLLKNKLIEE